jgi:regulation of enolase protein 1 (concanavalin A-like superfamily)
MLATLLVLSGGPAVASPSAANAQAQAIRVAGIDAPLHWLRAPLDYRVAENGIVITAPAKSDRYSWSGGGHAPDNAPQLVFDSADGDFMLSTAVSHKFESTYDAGGLIVAADARHWFKFAFERDYTGAHRVVSVVTNDYSDDANAMEIDANTAYLRVSRMGSAFALHVSKDGKSWLLVRIFRFEHKGPLKIGLIAQCPEGQRSTITFFDLKYRATRLEDIWARDEAP